MNKIIVLVFKSRESLECSTMFSFQSLVCKYKVFLHPPLGYHGLLHVSRWLHELEVHHDLSLEKMGFFSEGKFLCSCWLKHSA